VIVMHPIGSVKSGINKLSCKDESGVKTECNLPGITKCPSIWANSGIEYVDDPINCPSQLGCQVSEDDFTHHLVPIES
jgi:hypothetical protein